MHVIETDGGDHRSVWSDDIRWVHAPSHPDLDDVNVRFAFLEVLHRGEEDVVKEVQLPLRAIPALVEDPSEYPGEIALGDFLRIDDDALAEGLNMWRGKHSHFKLHLLELLHQGVALRSLPIRSADMHEHLIHMQVAQILE